MKILKLFGKKKFLISFLLGLMSGTPLLLLGQTLKYWLTEENIPIEIIGSIGAFAIFYNFKFIWSPFIDNYSFFKNFRRKSWIFITQVLLSIILIILSIIKFNSTSLFFIVLALAYFISATADIVIDATRREILEDSELGIGSTMTVYGYRIAMLLANYIPLTIASIFSWSIAYQIMSIFILFNLFIILSILEEPKIEIKQKNLYEAFYFPLVEFLKRNKLINSILILLFIILYKLGDGLASQITAIFYLNHGYNLETIKNITSSFGFFSTFLGMFIGSLLITKFGIKKCLFYFGILQILSTFGFSILSISSIDSFLFASVISFENISGGMGTSVFVAYISSITNKEFSATQYAALSSLTTLLQNIFSGFSGIILKKLDFFYFFNLCAFLGIPGIIILYFLLKKQELNHT